jgi:hypothetical protein
MGVRDGFREPRKNNGGISGFGQGVDTRDTIAGTGFGFRYVGGSGFADFVRVDPIYCCSEQNICR